MSSLPPLNDPRPGDRDPRPRASEGAPASDSAGALRPAVAASRPIGGLAMIAGGAVLLGVVTFVLLSGHRAPPPSTADRMAAATAPSTAVTPPPPAPSALTAIEAASRAPAQATLIPFQTAPPVVVVPPPPSGANTLATMAINKAALARKSPALVVDLAEAQPSAAATAKADASRSGGAPAAVGPTPAALSGEEQFAQRVGAAEPERSRATLIGNAKATIPQGAMIPGVLETALDSDLPGFARAVVSRDVRGFDGSAVLIPRGSRLIGQYKSAIAQGQSRMFVIWTRVIRPDGATIQIGSPVTDPLGRAGLDGKIDRHFFERFSGAILLSVLNAGVNSLANSPSTQVVIGSSAEATNLGAQALQPTAISPTIKVAQGAAIRIFVARDLDFSPVGGQ